MAPAVVSLLCLVALGLGLLGLVWIDHEATHLVVFMGFAGASASSLSLAWPAGGVVSIGGVPQRPRDDTTSTGKHS